MKGKIMTKKKPYSFLKNENIEIKEEIFRKYMLTFT